MSVEPFNFDLDDRQVKILKYMSIIAVVAYFLVLGVLLDTIRVHRLCRKGEESKEFNVYKFYSLSIFVCVARIFANSAFYKGLNTDDGNMAQEYNFGFYAAVAAIILIAF